MHDRMSRLAEYNPKTSAAGIQSRWASHSPVTTGGPLKIRIIRPHFSELGKVVTSSALSSVWMARVAPIDLMIWCCGRVRSCVRPAGALHMTVGPDDMHGNRHIIAIFCRVLVHLLGVARKVSRLDVLNTYRLGLEDALAKVTY